ncbi:hypothetical protein K456DRAFT_1906236 [Colletotrichum gloeosporioides 23]|nr:hypothetical protein K456DRAFT_1906236 [Colletotrichum gloeosporioides 23]
MSGCSAPGGPCLKVCLPGSIRTACVGTHSPEADGRDSQIRRLMNILSALTFALELAAVKATEEILKNSHGLIYLRKLTWLRRKSYRLRFTNLKGGLRLLSGSQDPTCRHLDKKPYLSSAPGTVDELSPVAACAPVRDTSPSTYARVMNPGHWHHPVETQRGSQKSMASLRVPSIGTGQAGQGPSHRVDGSSAKDFARPQPPSSPATRFMPPIQPITAPPNPLVATFLSRGANPS